MNRAIDTLNNLEAALNTAKANAAKAEGVCTVLYKQLRDEFGVSSIEEATNLYNEMKADMEQTEQRVKARIARLSAVLAESGRV